MPKLTSLMKPGRDATTEEVIFSEHLADLRSRVRLVTLISGLSWLSLAFLGGWLIVGTTDWFVHFDESGTRLLFLLMLIGGTGWVIWRFLFLPLRQHLSSSFLASHIERRFPGVHNRILSAVEFLENRVDARVGSTELQRAVIDEALRDMSRVQSSDIVTFRPIRLVAIAGSVTFFLATLVAILHPAEAATSAQRLALPFSNIPWPRAVELQLVRADLTKFAPEDGKPLLIARGDTLELYVENKRGKLPERVWFEYRANEAEPASRESLRITSIRDPQGQSHDAALLSWIASGGSLWFRATGGDDDVMPFHHVEVVPPPNLESLQVTLTPPAYLHRAQETLPPGVGHAQGYVGTTIDISGTSDKPLQSAVIRLGNQQPISVQLDDEKKHFTAQFKITEPGSKSYWFELTDSQGFTDREPIRYELRGIADAVPDVSIELPIADVMLTPEATLPVQVLAKDDIGLREVRIVYQIGDEESLHTIPLFSDKSEEKGAALNDVGPSPDRPQQHLADLNWKMSDLNPQPGMRVVFRAEATDDNDIDPNHVGKSVPRTITFASKEEKQREVATRVGNLLEDLTQATQLQQRTREQTQELMTQLDNVGELRSQDLDQLRRTEMDQRQTASRLTHSSDGIEAQAQQLLDEFRANQLKDDQTEQRLERLADEIGRLGRESLPDAEKALTQAQKLADSMPLSKPGRNNTAKESTTKNGSPNGEQPKKGENQPSSQGNTSSTAPQDEKQPANAETKKEPNPTGSEGNATQDSKENSKPDSGSRSGDESSNQPAESPPAPPSEEGDSPQGSPTSTAPNRESPAPDANDSNDAKKELEAALAEAKEKQTRSLETLQELRDALSEWRDRRDISRDLDSVIAEQEAVQKAAAEMAARTMTKSDAELTKQDRAELNKLAAAQKRVADQIEQFRDQLGKASHSLQQNDPDSAEKMKEVGEELRNQETASKLRDAAQDIAENRMGLAAKNQQSALDELRDVERMMKRRPSEDTEQFLNQTEEALQEFQQIRQEQQDLADQAEDLAKQPDSDEKKEQLEKLLEEQQELAERMAKAERKLERLRLHEAADAAHRARTRLQEMAKQATEADDAEEMQQAMEQALDDLEQVERELVLEKRIAQERLAFEQLEKVQDELKSLRAQQEAVITESMRIHEAKGTQENLTRGQLKTLRDLAETERSLQHLTEQLQQKMASVEVIALVLRRTARSLELASDGLSERKTGPEVLDHEKEAIRKMDTLLDVLQEQKKKSENQAQQQQQQEELGQEPEQQEQKPEQASPPGDSIPQLAQLKLLRTLQQEYLERTERLNRSRDQDGKLPEAMEAEKTELAREQAELADFARNLMTKFLQQQPEQTEPVEKKTEPAKKEQKEEPPERKTPRKEVDPSKIDL